MKIAELKNGDFPVRDFCMFTRVYIIMTIRQVYCNDIGNQWIFSYCSNG